MKPINMLCGQNAVLCCAHSVVIATLFNIIKQKISSSQCVSKDFLCDNRFDDYSVNVSYIYLSRMIFVRPAT